MAKCGKDGCSQPLSELEKIIKCAGFCNRNFHMSCAGISRSIEPFLSSAKGLLWFCDPCLQLHKSGISGIYKEILKSREHNQSLMEALYGRLKTTISEQSISIENAKSEILTKNDEIKLTYADAMKKSDDKKFVKKDPVVIVQPKDKKQGNDKTKSDIKNKINPNEIPVNGLFNANNGSVIIKCKKQGDIEKIKEIVNSDLGENYDVRIPESKNPRVKIVGIDEKPENNDWIIETLKNQNDEFFGESDIIKVVTVMEMKNRSGKPYFNLIIEINPKSFNKIMSIDDARINFNWNRCKIFDALYVKRCYRCCSFDGHNAKECTKNIVCYKCSENHKSDACTAEKLKCINCENAIKNLKIKLDSEHNALSSECQVFQRILQKKARSINYNE
jgi:hypothetical protein